MGKLYKKTFSANFYRMLHFNSLDSGNAKFDQIINHPSKSFCLDMA